MGIAPLPVGETGGSKGKGDGREGDHPGCTTPDLIRGRKPGDTRPEATRTLPGARGSAPSALERKPITVTVH